MMMSRYDDDVTVVMMSRCDDAPVLPVRGRVKNGASLYFSTSSWKALRPREERVLLLLRSDQKKNLVSWANSEANASAVTCDTQLEGLTPQKLFQRT